MTLTIRRTAEFDRWMIGLNDDRAIARIETRLTRLGQGNPGDVEPIGSGLLELRIAYGPGYRVYFGQRGKHVVVLLIGGDKRTQNRDIAQAKRLWANWQEEN
ncbi:hypothetical protein VZ95_04220 [Elstera litoralis]|uniref:Addiction module antitoxin RelB n=1 Tax=Elstera litoralis TaxID=552518 RepID=A0A0F3IVD3_9PROT|nr:type II toxin-antitoxin system RelE/ParE family toxin [Elstera litoralis]KJV10533.1 hypothetical protein VZ95_04220 [Elstera litoralis]